MGPTLVILLSAAVLLNSLTPARSDSVHDVLPMLGLPPGLLPDAVESYSLSSNGDFVVELTSTCYVHFSRLVYYEKRITGKVSYGKIMEITGIHAKKLFIWVSVTGIVAKPEKGEIEFQVGVFSESLSMTEFEKVLECKSKVAGCRGVYGVLGHKEEAAAVAAIVAEA